MVFLINILTLFFDLVESAPPKWQILSDMDAKTQSWCCYHHPQIGLRLDNSCMVKCRFDRSDFFERLTVLLADFAVFGFGTAFKQSRRQVFRLRCSQFSLRWRNTLDHWSHFGHLGLPQSRVWSRDIGSSRKPRAYNLLFLHAQKPIPSWSHRRRDNFTPIQPQWHLWIWSKAARFEWALQFFFHILNWRLSGLL